MWNYTLLSFLYHRESTVMCREFHTKHKELKNSYKQMYYPILGSWSNSYGKIKKKLSNLQSTFWHFWTKYILLKNEIHTFFEKNNVLVHTFYDLLTILSEFNFYQNVSRTDFLTISGELYYFSSCIHYIHYNLAWSLARKSRQMSNNQGHGIAIWYLTYLITRNLFDFYGDLNLREDFQNSNIFEGKY